MKNPSYLVLLFSCFLYLPAFAEPTLLVLSGEEHAGPAKARSKGVVFDRVRFDESGEIADAKGRSGSIFESYRPGNVWHGELPGFVSPEIEVGGEDRYSCTDVYEQGAFLYAHYGVDHYQTRVVSVIDANRKEVLRVTAGVFENIARLAYDPDSAVVYFTTVEWNNSDPANARLHAVSSESGETIWTSEPGTAHGNFLVYESHIVTHYGFTGEDDFLFVLDRGDGSTRKSHQVATAAEVVIQEGEEILAPCYRGVVTMRFVEK